MGLKLEDIVLIGRTFDEYCLMFNLYPEKLKGKYIIDIGGGVSSFCAEANHKGINVYAADPVYRLSAREIKERCEHDLDEVMKQMHALEKLYKWTYFRNIKQLKINREKALDIFMKDYIRHSERYVYSEFPYSNFRNNQFDISLISHFLFLYEDRMDYDAHRRVIRESLKTCKEECRIFPLVNLSGRKSRFLTDLYRDPLVSGSGFLISPVKYEFLKGGNDMLIIKKG